MRCTSPRSTRNTRMLRNRGGHAVRELLAVDGERRAGRHPDAVGDAHDERAQAAHLFLEQADGVVELVAPKRIAADELREMVGLVHGGRPRRGASRES